MDFGIAIPERWLLPSSAFDRVSVRSVPVNSLIPVLLLLTVGHVGIDGRVWSAANLFLTPIPMLSDVNRAGDGESQDSATFVVNGFLVGRLPPDVDAVQFLHLLYRWPMKSRGRDGCPWILDGWT